LRRTITTHFSGADAYRLRALKLFFLLPDEAITICA
jgi:hypothetical protein